MSTEDEDLTAIVQRFVAAEDALSSIAERREELRAAREQLLEARESTAAVTTASMDALESVRADLRARIEADERLAAARAELDVETGDVMAQIRDVLASLRAIDPSKFASELSELRRDGSDNAAEIREVRRLAADLQHEQSLLRASFAESKDAVSRLHALVDVARAEAQTHAAAVAGAAERVDRHLATQDLAGASLATRVNVTLVLLVVALSVAIVSLFV